METEVMERVSEEQLVLQICRWCQGTRRSQVMVLRFPADPTLTWEEWPSDLMNASWEVCPGCDGSGYVGAEYLEVAI